MAWEICSHGCMVSVHVYLGRQKGGGVPTEGTNIVNSIVCLKSGVPNIHKAGNI